MDLPPRDPWVPWLARDDRGVVRRLYCGPLSPILSALSRERVRIATYSVSAMGWLLAASEAVRTTLTAWGRGAAGPVPCAAWPLVLAGTAHITWFYYRALRDARPEAIDRPLAAGCCPCCRYPLEEVRAGPDGVRPCPECGAAWRLPVDPPMSGDQSRA